MNALSSDEIGSTGIETAKRIAAIALGVLLLAPPTLGDDSRTRPNIVVIVVDTLRADVVGWYRDGASVTPFLDELAERGGVVFRRAYANAPMTSPSVVSLLTSRYVSQHGVIVNGSGAVAEEDATLAELLKDSGYRTGAITANFIMTRNRGFAQGFDHYEVVAGEAPHRKLSGRHVNEAAARWLDSLEASTAPVFLYVQYLDPHIPHQAGPVFTGLAKRRLGTARGFPGGFPYAAEVLAVDEYIKRLWTLLEERGLLDDAIVVVTSDHGEQFFDHGATRHGNGLYEELVHVPLAVFDGRASVRRDDDSPVSLMDIAPTLLERAGVPVPARFEGRSLAPQLAGSVADEPDRAPYLEMDHFFAQAPYGNHRRAIVVWPDKVIEHRDGKHEFFDLSKDPREQRSDSLPLERRDALLDALQRARERAARQPSPRREMEPAQEDWVEALEALGYTE